MKMWDAGPLNSCPIQDTFYRRAGMRAHPIVGEFL